ncbi:LytTR family DNA-binding domain-containing protein [Intestinibacillus massiliensis]|uniref:LytR/AlgR family response regulator transcription factor n=1 Tax=Intestinibacillus massiliensis TaxID=1871029 RepID=UPI000B35197B|nr:LytTR family DNA-binding domain-containing protein [Intestinibacillus massiliensis]MCB6366556.1 LytTR family DNA-binding domain-containing protein [Intestinibacillus massiliensis]
MLRIAICEDMPSEAVHIEQMLAGYQARVPQLQIAHSVFGSAEVLLQAVNAGQRFDLYLLDIVMPGMDGIELVRALRGEGCRSAVIYLTASPEYAVQAFSVRATNYMVKPVSSRAFYEALDEVVAMLGHKVESHAVVPAVDGALRVPVSQIVCVEVTGHVLHYTLCDGRRIRSKVLRVSFGKAIADLHAAGFLRPHQSYAVNPAHIADFAAREFHMDNGMCVPISRLRFPEVKAAYMRYLARRGAAEEGISYAAE